LEGLKPLARELAIKLGILAERHLPVTKWGEPYWIPSGVMPVHSGHSVGDVILQTDKMTRYFMGNAILSCHASDTEAYIHNFESRVPALYVILRKDSDNRTGLPWYVHAVTASPYEAQDHQDNAEDIVERVEMPVEIASEIMDFVDRYHQEQPFRKRKRVDSQQDEQKFGKEPIFLNRGQTRGKLDG
jgi:hypothetical protein